MTHLSTSIAPQALWASPAGKARIAKQLAALLPAHATYVEPFAGSGAVLFAKAKSEREVLSDADPAIALAFRAARDLDNTGLRRILEADWTGNRATFKKALKETGGDVVDQLQRFLYVNQFSYLRSGRGFSPNLEGRVARTGQRVADGYKRLSDVIVEGGDYEAVVRKYDGPDTVFFFDPPYVGAAMGVGEKNFDEFRFLETLRSIKGKFLITYGSGTAFAQQCEREGFRVQQHFVKRNAPLKVATAKGRPALATYLIANYDLPPMVGAKTEPFERTIPIIKSAAQERYVLGVVLEPDVVDAHNHIYGVQDVRKAAHSFMQHQVVGVMHESTWQRVDVEILECYVMPSDSTIEGHAVRKGTWMLALRINDDAIWERIRSGELTGLSITGFATVTPLDPRISTERSKGASVQVLTDFDVREVHIVDLAANRRRFPVTKRSTPLSEKQASATSANTEQDAANDDVEPSDQTNNATPEVPEAPAREDAGNELTALRDAADELRAAAKVLADVGAALTKTAAVATTPDNGSPVRTEVVKSLTQRVARLEKSLPLPASESPERGNETTTHAWPFDINRTSDDDATASGRGGARA